MSYATIYDKLRHRELLVLAGGAGTDLQRRGVPMNSQTWCGKAAAHHLEARYTIHPDFLHAGANIITTNTNASSQLLLNRQ
jgi:homocysteine S-methyltransferase